RLTDRTAGQRLPVSTGCPSTSPRPAVSARDIEDTLLHTESSAPGQDDIPAATIKLAWPLIAKTVITLFAKSWELGWHPRPFRSALLCVLEKSGNRDRSSPHSYRLIALLAVLGKGLERLVAKRLSWTAIN